MMKKSIINILLILSVIIMFSLVLSGCIEIVVPGNTGTVRVTITGTYYYDILIDGVTKLTSKPQGTYNIPNVPVGYRTIEAIDIDGASFGYDSITIYISPGTNNVSLYPEPGFTTGTVHIVVSGGERYDLKMDGETKFTNVTSGTYTITNVSTGSHFFEAIDTWGASFGYDSKTQSIFTGTNYVYLNP